jgi:hypothetical protein
MTTDLDQPTVDLPDLTPDESDALSSAVAAFRHLLDGALFSSEHIQVSIDTLRNTALGTATTGMIRLVPLTRPMSAGSKGRAIYRPLTEREHTFAVAAVTAYLASLESLVVYGVPAPAIDVIRSLAAKITAPPTASA